MNLRADGRLLSQILNPTLHTLPFLYVLLAHINGPQGGKQTVGSQAKALSPGGQLWAKMEEFMERFDPVQIRYAGNLFPGLINVVVHSARIASKVRSISVFALMRYGL